VLSKINVFVHRLIIINTLPMPEISTLFFVYGIEINITEEIQKMEAEFSEELKWLNRIMLNPDDKVIRKILDSVTQH